LSELACTGLGLLLVSTGDTGAERETLETSIGRIPCDRPTVTAFNQGDVKEIVKMRCNRREKARMVNGKLNAAARRNYWSRPRLTVMAASFLVRVHSMSRRR
jgi:hypothetical protein